MKDIAYGIGATVFVVTLITIEITLVSYEYFKQQWNA